MDGMNISGVTGASAAEKAEMVQFKMRMDDLKGRLENGPSEEEELKQACRDFEAVFIGKLWDQMQKTVPQEGYLHSKQEGMYKSMFNKEFSEAMSDAGGIGLADMLYDQLAQKLKQVSAETLAANSQLKPLSENGKAEIKSLVEQRRAVTRLNGPEPTGPKDIMPEAIGPEVMGPESIDPENSLNEGVAGDGAVPAGAPSSSRDLSVMSRPEVEAELNALARSLASAPRQPRFMSAMQEGEGTGRKIAEI